MDTCENSLYLGVSVPLHSCSHRMCVCVCGVCVSTLYAMTVSKDIFVFHVHYPTGVYAQTARARASGCKSRCACPCVLMRRDPRIFPRIFIHNTCIRCHIFKAIIIIYCIMKCPRTTLVSQHCITKCPRTTTLVSQHRIVQRV
jgi:hypothetical protein